MHSIETTGIVTEDHQLLVRSLVPESISPGEHPVVVSIGVEKPKLGERPPLFRSAYDIDLTNDQITFRREEIYEDADQ